MSEARKREKGRSPVAVWSSTLLGVWACREDGKTAKARPSRSAKAAIGLPKFFRVVMASPRHREIGIAQAVVDCETGYLKDSDLVAGNGLDNPVRNRHTA